MSDCPNAWGAEDPTQPGTAERKTNETQIYETVCNCNAIRGS